jgi:hypothetical protein
MNGTFLSDLMGEIGVAVSAVRIEPKTNALWMTAEVKDWGGLLRSIGVDDEVLADHLQRWMNGHFEVAPMSGVRFFFDGDLPLPTGRIKHGLVDEEEFLLRYGKGDDLRDAVLIAALSRYDPTKLKAEIIEAIDSRVKTFLGGLS